MKIFCIKKEVKFNLLCNLWVSKEHKKKDYENYLINGKLMAIQQKTVEKFKLSFWNML